MSTRVGTKWAGEAGPLLAAAAWLTRLLRLVYAVSFRSRWRRLTWLVAVSLFLVILPLTGAVATLPSPAQLPFPPGTVRFSWTKGYLWWVVTPQVMLTLVVSHLAKAALLALVYGMNITLAVVRSRVGCCRLLALGGAGLVFGSLGISFLLRTLGRADRRPRTRRRRDEALEHLHRVPDGYAPFLGGDAAVCAGAPAPYPWADNGHQPTQISNHEGGNK